MMIPDSSSASEKRLRPQLRWPFTLVGFALGVLATATALWLAMPRAMIVTQPSRLGFDETVASLQDQLKAEGWSSPGTFDINQAMARQGESLTPRVKVIQLCKAPYAKEVLAARRDISCLMPCAIAVWEGDDGGVYVSKMNTGLMARMFGGTVARVMGQKVAEEEARILASVVSVR